MKGVFKCIKFLTFFITLALCFVLFSEDTSALTFTMELNPTGNEWTNPDTQCWYGSGSAWRTSTGTDTKWTCNNPQSNWDGDIDAVRTVNNYHVEEGKYYQIQMVLRNNNISAQTIEPMYWNFYNSEHFTNVGLEMYYIDERGVSQTCTYTSGSGVIQNSSCWSGSALYNHIVIFTVRANETGDFPFQIGTTTAVLIRANVQNYGGNYIYTFGMKKITEFESAGVAQQLERDEQDRDNLESQQSDSESGAEDSQGDAEQQGTTLLAAFTSFVSALTSATPSNCQIDMDLGNLDMGNVDLCQLSPPAGFSALASVFMILFCVPLSIATARKVISLFRSFQ